MNDFFNYMKSHDVQFIVASTYVSFYTNRCIHGFENQLLANKYIDLYKFVTYDIIGLIYSELNNGRR